MSKLSALPNLTEKQQWYATHIDSAIEQGISLSAYAKAQGIELKSLYNAHARLRQIQQRDLSNSRKAFVEVGKIISARHSNARVMLSNGVIIDLSLHDTPLRQLLQWANQL